MIQNVLVVGYGVMGRGIALSFARGGHRTAVLSRDPARIDDLPQGVAAVGELPEQSPDLVLESVPERLDLKMALFERVERAYGGAPILGTNTSGLSMDEMARGLAHPERFVGIHYFQPAEAFPMVEVIRTGGTDAQALDAVKAALRRNGQQALLLNRPVDGFLGNRLQHAILHEAFCMIEQGDIEAADVDNFCKAILGPRMCVTGLIEQKDISGLNTTATTQRGLVPSLHHTGTPPRVLQDLVAAGHLGVKTGRGFYDWRGRDVEEYQKTCADKLRRILAILAE